MPYFGRQTAYGALLSFVAVTILVTGYYLKPGQPDDKKQATADITTIQAEVERLRALAQRNSLRATSARFAEVAAEAASHLVFALPSRRTGVLWEQYGSVLLPADSSPPAASIQVRTGGKETAARPAVWGAGIPFTIVRPDTAPGAAPAGVGSPESLSPGAWILDVSLDSRGQAHFSPGNYAGLSSISCGATALPRLETNLPFDESSIGSGIFDLDGDLIGVVTRCGAEVAALSTTAVPKALAAAMDAVNGPLLRAGILVEQMSPKWTPLIKGPNGVVVTDVWKGWLSEHAGIHPGDVIASVDGEPAQTPADLSRSLEKGAAVNVRLWRAGKRRSVAIPSAAGAPSGTAPLELRDRASGVEIATVLSGSGAERAGLMPGDRILSLDRVPATRTGVMRRFASSATGKPALAEVERGPRKFLAVVAE